MKKCSLCEKEKAFENFYQDKRGVYSARCKNCHGIAERECVQCGSRFLGKANVKLCSDACRSNHRPQTFKNCGYCGESFGPVDRLSRIFCSHACKVKAQTTGRKKIFVPSQDARRANRQVAYAIQTGTLTRPSSCEACGSEGKIEGAHFDYSRPLDIRWLCRSCHVKWDAEKPKGGGVSITTSEVKNGNEKAEN